MQLSLLFIGIVWSILLLPFSTMQIRFQTINLRWQFAFFESSFSKEENDSLIWQRNCWWTKYRFGQFEFINAWWTRKKRIVFIGIGIGSIDFWICALVLIRPANVWCEKLVFFRATHEKNGMLCVSNEMNQISGVLLLINAN